MARKEKKYNYIYKITCLKNNRYYIGMHSTDNIEDGYMGGGKRIKNSVKRHGKDAHIKEILEFFENRDLLVKKEIELVNENLLKDSMCMNLNLGGEGDIRWARESRSKGARSTNLKNWRNLEFINKMKLISSNTMNSLWNKEEFKNKMVDVCKNAFKGKSHTDEFKTKMSNTMKGKFNGDLHPQYGSIWVTKDRENIKIKNSDLEKYISEGWIAGRYIKSSIDENVIIDIINRRKNGESYKKISSVFNISKTTIIRIIKNYEKYKLI